MSSSLLKRTIRLVCASVLFASLLPTHAIADPVDLSGFEIKPISVNSSDPTKGGNLRAANTTVSDDGKKVYYLSNAQNLVSGETITGTYWDNLFYWDADTNETICITKPFGAAGTTYSSGLAHVGVPLTNSEGTRTAFLSRTGHMVENFSLNHQQIFIYDQPTDTTRCISTKAGVATQGSNDPAYEMNISKSGKYTTFRSQATNLVTGYNAGSATSQIYIYDYDSGELEPITRDATDPTLGGNAGSFGAMIASDDRNVVFYSSATNLIEGFSPPSGKTQIYVYDTVTKLISCVSRNTETGAAGDGDSDQALISAVGGKVVFDSQAANLIDGLSVATGTWQSYIFDIEENELKCVSVKYNDPDETVTKSSVWTTISLNGKTATFHSGAAGLVGGFDNQGMDQIYCYDIENDVLTPVTKSQLDPTVGGDQNTSIASTGMPGSYFTPIEISGDGSTLAFVSRATNLIDGLTVNLNDYGQMYLYHVEEDLLECITKDGGDPTLSANGSSYCPKLSFNGKYCTFYSKASNLISGFDSGGIHQVYRYTTAVEKSGVTSLAHPLTSISTGANATVESPYISLGSNDDSSVIRYVVREQPASLAVLAQGEIAPEEINRYGGTFSLPHEGAFEILYWGEGYGGIEPVNKATVVYDTSTAGGEDPDPTSEPTNTPTPPTICPPASKPKVIVVSTVPKKSAIKKLTSTKKRAVKVVWKKDPLVSGYQVQKASNAKFTQAKKTYTIGAKKSTSKTISSLKSKKYTYVRVRAYKTIDGKKCYGPWSATLKVKVK